MIRKLGVSGYLPEFGMVKKKLLVAPELLELRGVIGSRVCSGAYVKSSRYAGAFALLVSWGGDLLTS